MGFRLNGGRLRDFLAKREIDNLKRVKASLEKARERKTVILKAKKETAEARIALRKLQKELDDIPDITSKKKKVVSKAGKSLKAVGKAATGKRTQTALKNLGKNLMEFSKHSEKYSKERKPKRKATKKKAR